MKCPMKGRQPGHDTTPAFTRERARRLPTPAPLRWTTRSRPRRRRARARFTGGASEARPIRARTSEPDHLAIAPRPFPGECDQVAEDALPGERATGARPADCNLAQRVDVKPNGVRSPIDGEERVLRGGRPCLNRRAPGARLQFGQL